MWSSHTVGYDSAVKEDQVWLNATVWVLANVMLSGKSQTQKPTHGMTGSTRKPQKRDLAGCQGNRLTVGFALQRGKRPGTRLR